MLKLSNAKKRKKQKRKPKFDLNKYAEKFERIANDYKNLCINRGCKLSKEEEEVFKTRIINYISSSTKANILNLNKKGLTIDEESKKINTYKEQKIKEYLEVLKDIKSMVKGTSKEIIDQVKHIDPELETIPTKKEIKELLDKDKKEKIEKEESKDIDTEKQEEVIDSIEGEVDIVLDLYSESKDELNKSVKLVAKTASFDVFIDLQKDYIADNYNAFTWITEKDKGVRCTHKMLHGKVFSFARPPIVDGTPRLPSEDYNCRCWYEPPKPNEPIYENYRVNRTDPPCVNV